MPSKSLKHENDELKKEIIQLKARNNHLHNLFVRKDPRYSKFIFMDSFDEDKYPFFRFNCHDMHIRFITLNYDPATWNPSTEEQEIEIYESAIINGLKDEDTDIEVEIHGTFEYDSSGKIHVHMLIQTYNVNGYVARMKTHLTHRRHLRASVDSRPVHDYDGVYIYMSKQNLPKFYFNNKLEKRKPNN